MRLFHLIISDRKTLLFLVVVVIAALGVIWLTNGRQEPLVEEQAVTVKKKPRPRPPFFTNEGQRQPELFRFDPNTADSTALLRLGLQPWQVRNVYRYRAAGGVFRRPSDFARLYGLTQKQFRQLEPYITIRQENLPAYSFPQASDSVGRRDTTRFPVKLQHTERVVLNLADTTVLRRVPGIGPYFARRIVEYRRRLGGFYSVRQLLEIEDFPDTAVAYFVIPDSTLPRRSLNVNRMRLDELKRHPYISFYQARAIIEYRRLHGRIENLHQLHLNRDFPPEAIKRLEPYVTY